MMNQQFLISLGWQLAGWLAVPLAVLGIKWIWAQSQLTVTDKRSAILKLLGQVAVTAVTALEQTALANPQKKEAALKFVSDYLAQHSINIPLAQIDAAIESAVATETAHTAPAAPAA
jgi:hypothetical protein